MMHKAIKNKGKSVSAWKLGEQTETELTLIREGKLKRNEDGSYEIFSREALSGTGERASAGDYIKMDSGGYPYPNSNAFFEANHRHIAGDLYEQIPAPVDVWFWEDGPCEEIQFLTDSKELKFHPENDGAFFSAPLWGTVLSAAKDAAIVFYSIQRKDDGSITDIDFNFVAKEEFDKTYSII